MSLLLVIVVIAVGSVVAVLAAALAFGTVADAVAGVPAVRRELAARGVPDPLIRAADVEWGVAKRRAALAMLALAAGAAGLLAAMIVRVPISAAPETVLFVVPSVSFLILGAMLFRRVAVQRDESPTYHALLTRAAEVVAIAPTLIWLDLDVTTPLEALFRRRVIQRRQIPHVVVHYRDRTTFTVRAFQDDDQDSRDTMRGLATILPHAQHLPPQAPPAAQPERRLSLWRPVATVTAIAAVTLGAYLAADRADYARREEKFAATRAAVDAAVETANEVTVPAGQPLTCPIAADLFDVAFATRDSSGSDRPGIMDRDAPFNLSSTGASAVYGQPTHLVFARIRRAAATRVTLAVVVVDVGTRKVICTGETSGGGGAAQGVRTTIENLLAKVVCRYGSKDPLCTRAAASPLSAR